MLQKLLSVLTLLLFNFSFSQVYINEIDADNSGFVINETATIAANTNGVSYIFLAVA